MKNVSYKSIDDWNPHHCVGLVGFQPHNDHFSRGLLLNGKLGNLTNLWIIMFQKLLTTKL